MSITHPLRSLRPFALALAALACPALLQAQNAAAAYGPPAPSRFEITAQYAYFHPFTSDINNYQYQTIQGGGLGDIAGYFNKYLGVELEGAAFPEGDNNNNCNYTAQAGPILRYPKGRFVPFFHVLGGAAEVGGPEQQRCTVWGWGVTGGFGLDYVLPGLGNHLALRPIQGDFNYAHIDNGPLIQPAGLYGGLGEIYNYRLSGGLTFRLGTIGQMHGGDTTLTCSADPATSFPGDPVTLTSSVMNLRTKHEPTYLWTSSGGKITGTEATAQLDTTGLAPGTYAVSANLVEGKHQRQIATCSTSFTVRPFEPPTISCSADRAAINSGDPVVITSNARSPQNRPLTYSYNSNSGQITGTGPTAQLSTAGVTPGTININCTVADDKGQSATARTSVVIATPPPPAPAPTASALCSLSFDRDPRRPDRVDNAAKACLDDIALTLNRDANARIVLIGNHGAKETNRDAAARSMNAAQYLTQEKGIDPARIDLRIAADSTRTVNTMLVPAGAPSDTIPGAAFDPSTVVRKGQPYGKPGQPATHTATHKTHTTTKHKKHTTHHKPASAPTVAQPQ